MNPGQDVQFKCITKRIPHWFFNNEFVDDSTLKSTRPGYHKLFLYNVQENNTGIYKCEGTTEEDQTFNAEMQLFVKDVTGMHIFILILYLM